MKSGIGNRAERDAGFLIDWLKRQAAWAGAGPSTGTDAVQRRYYEAFLAMSEEDWRLFVMAAFTRRMPMLPPLPQPDRGRAA